MKPKQIGLVISLVLVMSALSALVAYRLALRQLARAPAVGSTASAAPAGAAATSTGGCVDFRDAGAHTGETGCVSGRLLRVFTSRGGNSFLDFCQDYRNCPFTSVIFASDKNKFGNLDTLTGRQVEIHGNITVYQGRAEIIVRDPEQIHAAP
jgi:hypothetical protein